jgi:phage tail sheath protein FI
MCSGQETLTSDGLSFHQRNQKNHTSHSSDNSPYLPNKNHTLMHPLNHFFPLLILLFLTNYAFSQNQIAQVETAIPAFIGYAEKPGTGWLKPQRINSLAEYKRQFGGPAREENLQVTIREVKGSYQVTAGFVGEPSRHNLYYSMEAYFANGGGPCYVVPVAGYLTSGKELSAALLVRGLQALDREDAPSLIAIPEAQNLPDQYRMRECYDAALAQCARRGDRFAILDVGPHQAGDDILAVVKEFRKERVGGKDLSFGAAYAPNLLTTIKYAWDEKTAVVWQLPAGNRPSGMGDLASQDEERYAQARKALDQMRVVLPPSALVAGVYVQTDRSQGVWKAPANVSLKAVAQPVLSINQSQQETLNVDPAGGKSVNAIRTFSGKGTLVWGSRTLAGNDNEWRYVPVRRSYNMLEESIEEGTQWAVFEPNAEPLWIQLRASVENFMLSLWRKGAFQGVTPKEAFFVRVGLGYTMTAQDIANGRLIIEVGFAPLKPAEFMLLKIEHKMK